MVEGKGVEKAWVGYHTKNDSKVMNEDKAVIQSSGSQADIFGWQV